jgi:hypothetical protein
LTFVWQCRWNSHKAVQKVFSDWRTWHKTGRKCCGEDLDDLNEQTNAEFASLRHPGPASIIEYDRNLALYRENRRHLQEMCDDADGPVLKKRSRMLKMAEDIDALVVVYNVAYGATWAEMQLASTYSKLSQCGFVAANSASGMLFQNQSSVPELKKYVAEKLKSADGLFPVVPQKADDSDPEVDAVADDDSDESDDDDIPLNHQIRNQKKKWLTKHKPQKGESLTAYQTRLVKIMNGGVMGDKKLLLGGVAAINTLQLAADEFAVHNPGHIPLKIQNHREDAAGSTEYYIMFKKPACLPRPDDEWLKACQLTGAEELLKKYRIDQQLEAQEAFVVEKILKKKMDDDGEILYFVKWQGYTAKWNTWEPADNLLQAAEAINEFNKKSSGIAQKKQKKRKRSEDETP